MRNLLFKNYLINKTLQQKNLLRKYLIILKKNKLNFITINYITSFLLQKQHIPTTKKHLVCLVTGRSRSISSHFYLSRLTLKNLFLFKEIPNSSKNTY